MNPKRKKIPIPVTRIDPDLHAWAQKIRKSYGLSWAGIITDAFEEISRKYNEIPLIIAGPNNCSKCGIMSKNLTRAYENKDNLITWQLDLCRKCTTSLWKRGALKQVHLT